MRITIPKIGKLRKPKFQNLSGQRYLLIPVLDGEEKDKNLGTDYVIEFTIGARGPSRQGKVAYTAPGLGGPSPAILNHAWLRAYAVWKNSEKVETIP
jgi:hypothetical protein